MRTIRRVSSPSLYFAFAKKFRRIGREACFGLSFRSMLGRSLQASDFRIKRAIWGGARFSDLLTEGLVG